MEEEVEELEVMIFEEDGDGGVVGDGGEEARPGLMVLAGDLAGAPAVMAGWGSALSWRRRR